MSHNYSTFITLFQDDDFPLLQIIILFMFVVRLLHCIFFQHHVIFNEGIQVYLINFFFFSISAET